MDEYDDYEMFQDDSYEEEYGTHYGSMATLMLIGISIDNLKTESYDWQHYR